MSAGLDCRFLLDRGDTIPSPPAARQGSDAPTSLADSRIEGLDARIEASLVGRRVTIARSEAQPEAHRFMVGDSSEIGIL
ncbi:MAG: glucose-phosphate thymidylyltransferase [Miltoncostaeaceae bacterium]|jgi:hypothetical protein|nr:glucose-phosphate thymidylyltransferase [Miltoncostaeaceae bacterium]